MGRLEHLFCSLKYYWRTNLAVVLGVAAATAVMSGALLVGDSVRDSLRQMSLDRLAGVDAAWVGPRFIRQKLAAELASSTDGLQVAPAIQLSAALTRIAGDGGTSRAGNVSVYGVDDSLWSLLRSEAVSMPVGDQVVLNRRVANQLGVAVGDEVSLLVEIPATIPRDSLLGDRDETVTELVLTVFAIADDVSTPGRFGLNPSQQLPLNAFVALDRLQQQLGLSEVRPTIRTPVGRPARVNALFCGTAGESTLVMPPEQAEQLTQQLASKAELTDLGIKLTSSEAQGYFALESEQMILEKGVAQVGESVAAEQDLVQSPVLVYLLNQLGTPRSSGNQRELGYSMYSVAAGIEFGMTSPFGPLDYLAGGPPTDVVGDAIPVVINDWLASDLAGGDAERIAIGTEFPVRYHVVGDRGELPEEERRFRISGIVKLAGPAADRGLTPQIEGVTDVESYSDWREPFPLDHDAITDRDDAYWKAHRATPKVFLRLADAQNLWRSRYGQLTSLRLAPSGKVDLPAAMESYSTSLQSNLPPDQTGLILQPVKAQGLQAAAGTTDFTGLFIGFSFFLIAAALLLIGLLFRLGVEQRVRELGLLGAVGFEPRQVRRQLLVEGCLLACLGAVLGVPSAIGYAGLMIHGLKTWWNKAIGTQFLFLSVRPASLLYGVIGGIIMALAAIAWSVWQTRRVTTRELLQGATEPALDEARLLNPGRWARRISWGALSTGGLLLVASLAGVVPQSEAFAGFSWRVVSFFLLGTALLIGTLALLAIWLASDRAAAVQGRGTAALARLSLRNAARNRGRSLLTASLIASAAFVIVAVASGKRDPQSESPDRQSGNGGYLLVAESSQPILYDLNTSEGRGKLRLTGDDAAEQEQLDSLHIVPFRMRPGENASCLNLYKTQLPTILGVPADVLATFDREGRFRFADTPGEHPWRVLQDEADADTVPVIGDLNTLQYSLKLGIGGTLPVPEAALTDSELSAARLQVSGMLDGSIFQGVLMMSESNFLRLFPNSSGYRFFLVEGAESQRAKISELLETKLSDSGFDAEPIAARLADFLAVQNTYLSTFQTLGGLGLLLGTIGLATVMLRNVLERRSELALLRALGLQPGSIVQLVWWENLFLLLAGLSSGAVSALLAMRPHLSSAGADTPWSELALLLGSVLLIGLIAPLWAGWRAAHSPVLASLRSE
ncbi:MAG: FtsX-like permease family protein [Planctomycetaceae bacterium]